MKIIVAGAKGMLGSALVPCLESRGHTVRGLARNEFDITNYGQVSDVLGSARPDLVIDAAAYTKVDQAESEPDLAFEINGYGTENLAIACNRYNLPLLYVSTDYVFDGEQDHPYTTWDKTNPLSVYGKSKLSGETAITRHLNKFYIVRTSWLYGLHGKNFVDTISRIATEKKTLRVVCDQWGSPTNTATLSDYLADLIATQRWGVYHATDHGVTNWCEFAQHIVSAAGLADEVEVEAIQTADMPLPATRPRYSVLDKSVLIHTIGRDLVPWQEALQQYLSARLAPAG
jgi:dTDP-4-dehydrorhamnose reductase